MNSPIHISPKEARFLALSGQGLTARRQDTLDAIRQLSYIQIDTISVTARSHHHVLHTRNSKYKSDDLWRLMANRQIFEYWSHAAAFLPMDDYRFSLYKKHRYRNGEKHWFDRNKKVETYIMDRIRAEGPLQSRDFESPKKGTGDWYEWKPAKQALTNLFMDGSLMISARPGFQKVYDLTERVLPASIDTRIPSENEYYRYLVDRAIQAHGIVALEEITYLRKGIKAKLKEVVETALEEGDIVEVQVEGNSNSYLTTLSILDSLNNRRNSRQVHILNPFDNLLIQRKRVKDLFDFDYIIECYVPEKKRVFGYYTLAVMYGDAFVLRFDAKADRKRGVLSIKGLWYERGFKPSELFQKVFDKKLMGFARLCGCEKIEGI